MLPCVSACFAQSNLLYSTLCSNKAQAEYSHQRHCTLQRAAVYCSMLQCDEVCYSMRKCGVLQLTTPPLAQTRHRQNTGANAIACCIVMQCVIVCCSVLQCATSWCIATQPLQHLLEHGTGKMLAPMPLHIVVRCSVLQCVAVCCSVLQCVAVCCSVQQHGVLRLTHSNTCSNKAQAGCWRQSSGPVRMVSKSVSNTVSTTRSTAEYNFQRSQAVTKRECSPA